MTATLSKPREMDSQEKSLHIGIPTEIYPNECRVGATPDTAKKLQKLGFTVLIQSGAGEKAKFDDRLYEEIGCKIVNSREELWQNANIILKVRPPESEEVNLLSEGKTLISFIYPAQNKELLEELSAKKVTVLAMDAVPRISRAQKLDALSSMANIAGYRAVVEAANNFGRFFYWANYRCRKSPSSQGISYWCGGSRISRHRYSQKPWCNS